MPNVGLQAIIGGDARPLKKELDAVDAMSKRAGAKLASNLAGGGGHGPSSFVVRETLVLLREISRGNWTRVPGSLSLLISRLGLFSGITTAAVGVLGAFGAALTGIGIAAGIVYGRIYFLTKAFTGLKLPDFNPQYIARHLQSVNQAAEGWKKINEGVRKSVELYDSAAKRAERLSEATKTHFEHLRKMNEFEKDPVKRAANELAINREERRAELAEKTMEQWNLTAEAVRKKNESDAIRVNSKLEDEEILKNTAGQAQTGREFLDKHTAWGGKMDRLKALLQTGDPSQFKDIAAADRGKVQQAADAIQNHKDAVNRSAANDEQRARKQELLQEAITASGKATSLFGDLQTLPGRFSQRNRDESEEAEARLYGGRRMTHGSVNSLQRVGAYAAPAVLSIGNKQLHELKEIRRILAAGQKSGGVQY